MFIYKHDYKTYVNSKKQLLRLSKDKYYMSIFKDQNQLNQYLASIQLSQGLSYDFYKQLIADNESVLCDDCSTEQFRNQNRTPETKSITYEGVNLVVSECGDVSSNTGLLTHYKRSTHYTVKINQKYVPIAKLMLIAFCGISKPLSVSYKSGIPELLTVRNLDYKHAIYKGPLIRKDFVFTADELAGYAWSFGISTNEQLLKRLDTSEDDMLGSLRVKRQDIEPNSVTWRNIEYRGIDLSVNQYGAVKKMSLSKNIPKVLSSCFVKGKLTVTILDSDRKKMRIAVASLMMRAFHGVSKSKIHVEYLDGNSRNTILRNLHLVENRYSAKN